MSRSTHSAPTGTAHASPTGHPPTVRPSGSDADRRPQAAGQPKPATARAPEVSPSPRSTGQRQPQQDVPADPTAEIDNGSVSEVVTDARILPDQLLPVPGESGVDTTDDIGQPGTVNTVDSSQGLPMDESQDGAAIESERTRDPITISEETMGEEFVEQVPSTIEDATVGEEVFADDMVKVQTEDDVLHVESIQVASGQPVPEPSVVEDTEPHVEPVDVDAFVDAVTDEPIELSAFEPSGSSDATVDPVDASPIDHGTPMDESLVESEAVEQSTVSGSTSGAEPHIDQVLHEPVYDFGQSDDNELVLQERPVTTTQSGFAFPAVTLPPLPSMAEFSEYPINMVSSAIIGLAVLLLFSARRGRRARVHSGKCCCTQLLQQRRSTKLPDSSGESAPGHHQQSGIVSHAIQDVRQQLYRIQHDLDQLRQERDVIDHELIDSSTRILLSIGEQMRQQTPPPQIDSELRHGAVSAGEMLRELQTFNESPSIMSSDRKASQVHQLDSSLPSLSATQQSMAVPVMAPLSPQPPAVHVPSPHRGHQPAPHHVQQAPNHSERTSPRSPPHAAPRGPSPTGPLPPVAHPVSQHPHTHASHAHPAHHGHVAHPNAAQQTGPGLQSPAQPKPQSQVHSPRSPVNGPAKAAPKMSALAAARLKREQADGAPAAPPPAVGNPFGKPKSGPFGA